MEVLTMILFITGIISGLKFEDLKQADLCVNNYKLIYEDIIKFNIKSLIMDL